MDQPPQYALSQSLVKEVPAEQIDVLIKAANKKEQQLLVLLLSGLALQEIAALQFDNFDLEKAIVAITGTYPRHIPLHPLLKVSLQEYGLALVNPSGDTLSQDDLAALLTCAIVDAGLPVTDDISAASLRHTYIAYLVRQGVRLSELEKIVGYVPPAELSIFSKYAPVGPKRGIDEIELFYPLTPSPQA